MRVIIAGSRSITDLAHVVSAMREVARWDIEAVLCGGAPGVDQLGAVWAAQRGIRIDGYPAEWKKWGKAAGFKRNIEMARNAHALVAVWDGRSPGTSHMIRQAHDHLLLVHVYKVLS